MTSRFSGLPLILLMVVAMVQAQITDLRRANKVQSGTQDTKTQSESTPEANKAREERQKKLLALLDEIIQQTRSLKLPENRVRIQISLAGSLWPIDEKRARVLFKDAEQSFMEIRAILDTGDPELSELVQTPASLRQEIVAAEANCDPRMAVDFLRATRDPGTRPQNTGHNIDAQLQMRIARQMVSKDPDLALSIAEDSLKQGLDWEAMNLLQSLQSKKPLAEKFLDDIIGAIRTSGIGNNAETPIAVNLLRIWSDNNKVAANPSATRTSIQINVPNLNDQTARELTTMVVNALLREPLSKLPSASRTIDGPDFFPGQLAGLIPMLKPMLPDLERLVPSQIGAFKNRINELDNLNSLQQGPWYKYQELTQNGTPEALLEASKSAPPEMTQYLVGQAAWKAMNSGDNETAKQIIEKISDPFQRNEMKSQLLRQNLNKAREQSKLADARALISQIPSIEERATLLAQLATSYKENGDRATALQLLGEAEAVLGVRAQSYGQLQARVQIAQAYNSIEPETGTATIERVIQQANELVSAVVVLNGFDVQGYFRNGEFILNNGNALNTVASECGRTLAAGASKNFDHARLVAEQIERPELRLIALVQIAESMIAAEPQLAAATRVDH
jgi:hypothetical protein